MSDEFDASLLWGEPVGSDILAAQQRNVDDLMKRPSALANAKLHAERELERLVIVCNRPVWGAVPSERRVPSAAEAAELLGRLGPEEREKLLENARLAAAQRQLVAAMAEAEARYMAEWQAEQQDLAAQEAERLALEEFEADDAAGKAERFAAWRASRP